MTRKLRTDYPGAFHHVMCKGNNGSFIFESPQLKARYLNIIVKYKEVHDIKLLSYCIMDNHAHLLVLSDQGNLSHFMHDVQLMYSKTYHRTKQSTGQNYTGRFRSYDLYSNYYLINVIRYIHLNPLEAGLTSDFEYPWSSYRNIYFGKGPCDHESLYTVLAKDKHSALVRFEHILQTDCLYDVYDIYINRTKHLNLDAYRHMTMILDEMNLDLKALQARKPSDCTLKLRNSLLVFFYKHINASERSLATLFKISRSTVKQIISNDGEMCN